MATVRCAHCTRERAGLERAPLSGPRGQKILASVCAACWAEWREESIRIINHLGLQPARPDDRARLYDAMRDYLKLPPD